MDSYLRSLEIEIHVEAAAEFSIPRIAQLTQRTNQFNLTTRRYSEADIKALAEDDASEVFCVSVRDKFGDYGIVGVAIIRYRDGEGEFDTFLLSCRVIGRGIEDAFLTRASEHARHRCDRLVGRYVPTRKNGQVADFYPKRGFTVVSESADEAVFQLGKDDALPPISDALKSVQFTA